MKRTVIVLLAAVASSGAAQAVVNPPGGPGVATHMVGRPIPEAYRGQHPPTLPFRTEIRPQPVTKPGTGRVRYIPAPYPVYAYPQQQADQNISVNVTNIIETPPAQIVYAQMPMVSASPMYTKLWDANADLAEERARQRAVADFDPDRDNYADDVKTLESTIAALYDVLSGPRGTPRNWDRFRSLFSDGARLIATQTDGAAPARPTVMTPSEYATIAAPVLERGVFEKEVSRSVERFGAIAHVFSTYEVRRMSGDATPYQRGINSIQLMNDGTRWWIMSVSWDSERENNPIPAKYLPARK